MRRVYKGGKQTLNGKGARAAQSKELTRLGAQLADRDQMIGELAIANRILKTLGRLELSEALRAMANGECSVRLVAPRLARVLGARHCALGVVRGACYEPSQARAQAQGRARANRGEHQGAGRALSVVGLQDDRGDR